MNSVFTVLNIRLSSFTADTPAHSEAGAKDVIVLFPATKHQCRAAEMAQWVNTLAKADNLSPIPGTLV